MTHESQAHIAMREACAGHPFAMQGFREYQAVVLTAAAFVAKQKKSDSFGAELEALEKALVKGGFLE